MKNIELEIRFKTGQNILIDDWLILNAQQLSQGVMHDLYLQNNESPYIYIDAQGKKDACEWLRVREYHNEVKLCLSILA